MSGSSIPPISSPCGEDTFPWAPKPDEKCIRVRVELHFWAIVRYTLSEWFTPFTIGFPAVSALVMSLLIFPLEVRRFGLAALPLLFVLSYAGIVLFATPIALLLRLCSKRRFEIWFSQAGLWKRYPKRDIFFPWRKFFWILERGDDVWLATFFDGCFIPRESFASNEERREFVAILREIKRTHGSVWRDKWNGRVFGLHSDEVTGARNSPR
jgi:hypothetical protein